MVEYPGEARSTLLDRLWAEPGYGEACTPGGGPPCGDTLRDPHVGPLLPVFFRVLPCVSVAHPAFDRPRASPPLAAACPPRRISESAFLKPACMHSCDRQATRSF